MLELRDIHTYYGDSYVLQGLTLSVRQGEIVSLLGRNGVGKTTTIRSIMGFTPPREGQILYRGEDITRSPSFAIARRGVGLVPQGRRIFGSLSVLEQLTLGAAGAGQGAWTLELVYELFPRLEERRRQRAATLSGGEQSMLSIARALMTNPDLLLMDEPTEGLAPLLVAQVAEAIVRLKDQEQSTLLVEQNLSFALELADRVYVMSKGVIVFEGAPEELRDRDDIQSRYLGV
jgi:branched-chain amino acid transport system ATP-binding protein